VASFVFLMIFELIIQIIRN